ncbi:Uncharacterised protein [uncultured archaeon]|nr:Uncharacterised protein [uncultured archaeon]
MAKVGDIEFLSQAVNSLDQGLSKLEEAYNKKDYDLFNKSKKFILEMESKIQEVANEQ